MTALHHSTTRRIPTRLGALDVRIVGDGEPVVLWHSMFVDSTSWDRIVPSLAQSRRLILVDAPSSAGSDPLTAPSDIAGCADAAVDLLAGLRDEIGDQPVDWVGNAWGGHVGMHLAAIQPGAIRRLIAISAPTHPIDAGLRRKLAILLPLYRLIGAHGPVRSAITETLLTDHTRAHDPEGTALITGPLDRAGRAGIRPMITAIRTAILNRTDLAWAAERINCPVLFVTTDDRGEWTPEQARAMAARMPDATEATVIGSRVLPSIEQPAALVRVMQEFWAAH